MPMSFGRDFPAAFGNMQDAQGLTGTMPATPSSRTRSSASKASSFSFSRLMRKKIRADCPGSLPSTPSPMSSSTRSSMDSQITLTSPPTMTAVVSKPVPASRDYESAFASLSSTYGFGGSVPTPTPLLPSSTSRSARSKTNRSTTHNEMDEQSAHSGKLLSKPKHGFDSGPSIGGVRR